MEIEIPAQIYEDLYEKAEETDSTVEKIVELAFRNFIERNGENAD